MSFRSYILLDLKCFSVCFLVRSDAVSGELAVTRS